MTIDLIDLQEDKMSMIQDLNLTDNQEKEETMIKVTIQKDQDNNMENPNHSEADLDQNIDHNMIEMMTEFQEDHSEAHVVLQEEDSEVDIKIKMDKTDQEVEAKHHIEEEEMTIE